MSDKREASQIPSLVLTAERLLDAGDVDGAERAVRNLAAADERSPEAHYLLGEVARRRADVEGAARHYRRAIQLDARLSCAHQALANALQDAAKLEEAIDAYRRAARLAPESAELWNDLGTAYFAAGKPERAVESYRNALRHAPGHIVALSNLGAALRSLGDVRGALRAYLHELSQRVTSLLSRDRRRSKGLMGDAERWLGRGSERMAGALADLALLDDATPAGALAIKADIARRRGDNKTAAELLEQALRSAPNSGDFWLRLARVQAAREQFKEAAYAYRQSLAHGERSVAAQRELAVCLVRQDRGAEALAELARLAARSRDSETWTLLGRARLYCRDEAGAEQALESALSLDALYAPALAQLARLRLEQKKPDEARRLCEAAVVSDPTCAQAHFWHGSSLGLAGRREDAVAAFREAAALEPSDRGLVRALAGALRVAERTTEAESVLREALERWPGDFDLRAELVVTLLHRGEATRAREILEKLLEESPDHVDGIASMSAILDVEGRIEEAEACSRRALRLVPDHVTASYNLAMALLKMGRFAEGWDLAESRRQMNDIASVYLRFPYPEWDGSSLAGKTLLIYAEQGLGDEIMAASCVPDAMRSARQVVLECDPRLGQLFKRSFPGCVVFGRVRTQVNKWTQSLDPQPDLQVPVVSLGRHFRRDRKDFPEHAGYLRPDPAKVERWRAELGTLGAGKLIGVSWRGGVARTNRVGRSLELADLLPLLRLEGFRFVSLQYGAVKEDLERLEHAHGVRLFHAQEAIDDYDEGAALIHALGGVISVCTALVHLTGALGRPALVMTPFSPGWRYGMTGEGMPWYPSVRIVRQPAPGDWRSVLTAVRTALQAGWGERLGGA